jgi:opacity protein-like surface antigen
MPFRPSLFPFRFSLLIATIFVLSTLAYAQPEPPSQYQIYGGYSYLSNTMNGIPGAKKSLNGFDAAVAFPHWHNVRFKIDVSGYRGTNLGAPQNPYFILGGAQYDIRLNRFTVYVEGLGGIGGANKTWSGSQAGATTGETASFAAAAGGGADARITRHVAVRVAADFQYSYFSLETKYLVPFRTAGLPTDFAHFSSGLVWNF